MLHTQLPTVTLRAGSSHNRWDSRAKIEFPKISRRGNLAEMEARHMWYLGMQIGKRKRLVKDLVQGRVYDVPAFSLGREAASSFVTIVLRRSCLRSVGKHRGAAIHSFSWTFVVQNTFWYLIHH